MRISAEVRFRKYVSVTESCWNWTGCVLNTGYGQFRDGSDRRVVAHRFSYVLHKGYIPAALELDHLCKNRKCVNPDHLEPVTHLENLRRGNTGGRKFNLTGGRKNIAIRNVPSKLVKLIYDDSRKECLSVAEIARRILMKHYGILDGKPSAR